MTKVYNRYLVRYESDLDTDGDLVTVEDTMLVEAPNSESARQYFERYEPSAHIVSVERVNP